MSKAKSIITSFQVIIVLLALAGAYVAINGGITPHLWDDGVAIRNVVADSAAGEAGIVAPEPNSAPTSRERVLEMNGVKINDISDYYDFVSKLEPRKNVRVKTNLGLYKLKTREAIEIRSLGETEIINVSYDVFNNETNETSIEYKLEEVNKTENVSMGTESLGLSVYDSPKTNINKGLDLQGGIRVLLQPEEFLEESDMQILIDNMKTRLNVYGLSDMVVRETKDLSGNQYVMVEIPGAQEEDVKDLLSKQGKFEAVIGNTTVFRGGDAITHVCRTADCSGINSRQGCGQSGDQWACSFMFAISLSPESARNQAAATGKLDVYTDESGEKYLTEKLGFYLDDVLVNELAINAGLKGKAETDIAISGPGYGRTREEAITNTLDNMNKLQTILITGSLPTKLDVVKTDAISPVFGEQFVNNALLMGLFALLSVGVVILIRYRSLKIALPIIVTSFIEVGVLLGFAAFARNFMTIDLAAIAGIIISVGSGVDHLIVITDETLRGSAQSYDWKKKIKEAFTIVFVAYFTTLAAMIPLGWAGAGMLKGFAITTIVGVSIGVLIARPAYAKVIEILLKKSN